MPLLAPVTSTALETVCSLDCAGAHSSAASNAQIVIRSARMAASLLRTEDADWTELHSAPVTTLLKSSLSLVRTTRRTQTACCNWPAIRCRIDLTDAAESRLRWSQRLPDAPLRANSCRALSVIAATAGF